MNTKILCLTFSCLLASFTLPQRLQADAPVLALRIVDIMTQLPISDVTVKVLRSKDNALYTTDKNGHVRLPLAAVENKKIEFLHTSYKRDSMRVRAASSTQPLTIYLEPKVVALEAVTLRAKDDNRAKRVLDNVVKNKTKNYRIKAQSYFYLLYSSIDAYLSLGNGSTAEIPKALKAVISKKELAAILAKSADVSRQQQFADTKIPVFTTENLLKRLVDKEQGLNSTVTLNHQIHGLGIQDEDALAEFLNPQDEGLLNIDITDSVVRILNRYFISPLNSNWRFVYEVGVLRDSIDVDGQKCIELHVFPKKKQMLGFRGSLLIRYSDYAVLDANLSTSTQINLNFLRNIKIHQRFAPLVEGSLLPVSTELTFNLAYEELFGKNNTLFVRTRVLRTTDDIYLQKDAESFNNPNTPDTALATVAAQAGPDATTPGWNSIRQKLGIAPKASSYAIIDALNHLSVVKKVALAKDILSQGFVSNAPVVLNDPLSFLAYNNLEGLRLKVGVRTTHFFSNKVFLFSSLGYGIKKRNPIGHFQAKYVFAKTPYAALKLSFDKDVAPVGQIGDNVQFLNSSTYFVRSMYTLGTHFGDLLGSRPMTFEALRLGFIKGIGPYLEVTSDFKYTHYQYLLSLNASHATAHDPFSTSEVVLNFDYRKAKKVRTVDDEVFPLERYGKPQLKFWYLGGLYLDAGASTPYHKINFNLYQRNAKVLALGKADYDINLGYIFGTLPFPLLRTPLSNRTFFLIKRAFSTISMGEFIMDKYAMLQYSHKFDAPLYDYLPIFAQLRKWLKVNLVGSLGIIFGDISADNDKLLKAMAERPLPLSSGIHTLTFSKPFIEAGVGLTNIFKIFRVEFVKRLTYLDDPAAPKWNLLLSTELDL